jgi:hypothetical protein
VANKQHMGKNTWASLENGALTLTVEKDGGGTIFQEIVLDENTLIAVLNYIMSQKGLDPFVDGNGMIILSEDGQKIARDLAAPGRAIHVRELGTALQISQLLVRMKL